MSSTSTRIRSSSSANTSDTDRPDAAIRARSARFTSTIAAGTSSGTVSQCGSGAVVRVGAAGVVIVDPSGNR